MSALRFGLGSFVALALGAGVFACASDDPASGAGQDANAQQIPDLDAGDATDASIDGGCDDASGCITMLDCSVVDSSSAPDFCATTYPVARTTAFNAIWGSARDDVWIAGDRGTILHGDGTSFTPIKTGSDGVFFAVWGTSKTDVWFLDGQSPYHSTGFLDGNAALEPVLGSSWNPDFATMGRLWAGYSTSVDSVWLGGEPSSRFAPSWEDMSSFWRLGVDADEGPVWNGMAACSSAETCAPQVRAFWGDGASTLWAVGTGGQAFVLDDREAGHWAYRNPHTSGDLEGVWGSSANDVWAVGQNGAIRHASADGTWSVVPSPTTQDLHAVWGSSAKDVWAVGEKGTVLHFDGTAWTLATIGLSPEDAPTGLFAIWGSGPDDVWIAGNGLLLHRTSASRRRP